MTADTLFFCAARMRHTPQRYALLLTPGVVQRRYRNDDQRRGTITNALIAYRFAGVVALPLHAGVDGSAGHVPLDIETGAGAALYIGFAQSAQHHPRCLEHSCRRSTLAEPRQRAYTEVPFDQRTSKRRVQQHGADPCADVGKVERNASAPSLAGTACSACAPSPRERAQSRIEPVR